MLVAALVPFEKTVTAVLEKLTGRSVMQAALIGLSPQEEHDMYWTANLDLRGRHVVQFIFEGNDLLDSHHYRARKVTGNVAAEPRSLLLQEVWNLLAKATDRTRAGMRSCAIDGQIYTFLWGRNSFEGFEGEFMEIVASLESFADRVRSAGGRYSAVFVPKKLRVLADLCTFPEDGEFKNARSDVGTFRDDMNAWSGKSGIPVFDLTEPLVRVAKDGRIPWFWGDTHWNDVGQAAAARALAEW